MADIIFAFQLYSHYYIDDAVASTRVDRLARQLLPCLSAQLSHRTKIALVARRPRLVDGRRGICSVYYLKDAIYKGEGEGEGGGGGGGGERQQQINYPNKQKKKADEIARKR